MSAKGDDVVIVVEMPRDTAAAQLAGPHNGLHGPRIVAARLGRGLGGGRAAGQGARADPHAAELAASHTIHGQQRGCRRAGSRAGHSKVGRGAGAVPIDCVGRTAGPVCFHKQPRGGAGRASASQARWELQLG